MMMDSRLLQLLVTAVIFMLCPGIPPPLSNAATVNRKDVCITVYGPLLGGFSNSHAFYNAALLFCQALSYTFLPSTLPENFSHRLSHEARKEIAARNKHMRDEMHRQPLQFEPGFWIREDEYPLVTLGEISKEIAVFSTLRCSKELNHLNRCPLGDIYISGQPAAQTLTDYKGLLNASANALNSTMPQDAMLKKVPKELATKCKVIVAVSSDLFGWRAGLGYSRTFREWADRFHNFMNRTPAQHGGPACGGYTRGRLCVGIHFRMGDVLNEGLSPHQKDKYMAVTWPIYVMSAIASVVPDRALDIEVHTNADSKGQKKTIQKLIDHWLQRYKFHRVTLFGMEESPLDSFVRLATSDMLIVGTSGFGRLAGTVSHGIVVSPADLHRMRPKGDDTIEVKRSDLFHQPEFDSTPETVMQKLLKKSDMLR